MHQQKIPFPEMFQSDYRFESRKFSKTSSFIFSLLDFVLIAPPVAINHAESLLQIKHLDMDTIL